MWQWRRVDVSHTTPSKINIKKKKHKNHHQVKLETWDEKNEQFSAKMENLEKEQEEKKAGRSINKSENFSFYIIYSTHPILYAVLDQKARFPYPIESWDFDAQKKSWDFDKLYQMNN